jgi:hypothetical protein
LLVDGHESGLVEVLVLLVFVVNEVGSEGFHAVVQSVATEVLAGLLHEVLGPVLVSVASVGEFVVLDHLKSVLQDTGVEERVKSITRSTQGVDTRTILATVLLLGQIFYTRDPINEDEYVP